MKIVSHRNFRYLFCFILIVFLTFCGSTYARANETNATVNETLLKAISTNPEIQAKWHSFLASDKDLVSAKGGYLPKLDLTAGLGRENLDGKGYAGRDFQNYSRDGVTLSLTQMIFDGKLTYSQTKRYTHSKKMRYFNLISSMEQIGLAAIRSHEDVLRYRTLVEMAKGNLERHQVIMDKIEKRTIAGVDSKVNFETTKGRLSLARVNLMTEESNLHDSITQYVRIVGENPADILENASIDIDLPIDPKASLEEALSGNSQVSSYEENAKSMLFAIGEQKSKMYPRLDIRASANFENDVDGTEGRRDKALIELILRYNLFNGGSDKANIEKSIELHKESEENLKKVERDITQSVLVAHNDVQSLQNQLADLEQHRISADNTRIVYGKQFEAGRRSLLDLLDAENEYFQADRALANTEFNLVIAKTSYLTATGQLLIHYDVLRDDVLTAQKIGEDTVRTLILCNGALKK